MNVSNSFRVVPVRMNRHDSFFLYLYHISYHIPYHIYITFSIVKNSEKIPRTPNFQKKQGKYDF